MNLEEAKKALDKVIDKARVHLYKLNFQLPIKGSFWNL